MKHTSFKPLAIGLVAISMASCTLEPLNDDMRVEMYTRAFIKQFGLVSPDQDWNMAKSVTVVVNLGGRTPKEVKMYGRQGNTYYLIANLQGMTGKIDVPVDVPKSCNEILVSVDGDDYYGKIDEMIDCTGAPQSRGVVQADQTQNGVRVQVTQTPDYEVFNTQQVAPIVSNYAWSDYYSMNIGMWASEKYTVNNSNIGLLPESGEANRNFEDEPKTGITRDFVFKLGTSGKITIYPYYWNATLVHRVGIYLIDGNGKPVRDGNDNIIKYPIFDDKEDNDMMVYVRRMGVKHIQLDTSPDNIEGYNDYYYKNLNNSGKEAIEVYKIELNEGDTYQIEPWLKDEGWNMLTYDEATTTSRIAYHTWSADPGSATCSKSGLVTAVRASENMTTVTISCEGVRSILYVKVNSTGGNNANTVSMAWESNKCTFPSALSEYLDNTDGHKYTFSSATDQNFLDFVNAFENYYTKDNYANWSSMDLREWSNSANDWITPQTLPSPQDYTVEFVGAGANYWWAQINVTFTKRSAAPRRNVPAVRKPSSSWSRAGAMPSQLEETGGEWVQVNRIYDGKLREGDESASTPVDFPMLAKTKGYTIQITDAEGHPYTGYVGMYIDCYDNPAENVQLTWPEGNSENWHGTDYSIQTSNYKYTLYSQRSQNVLQYAGKNFEFSYGCAFNHPVSDRPYLSFEDWQVSHPGLGDTATDGVTKGYAYSADDYSSDRDFNDLLYVMSTEDDDTEILPEDQINPQRLDYGFTWLWALEDLGSTDDFDFNDLVMEIQSMTTTTWDTDGKGNEIEGSRRVVRKVTLTPKAAGGILPLYVHFKYGNPVVDYVLSPGTYNLTDVGTNLPGTTDGEEFHEWFGRGYAGRMINTGVGPRVTAGIRGCTLILPADFALNTTDIDAHKSQSTFYVTVNGPKAETASEDLDAAYTVPNPVKGEATQSFILYCGQNSSLNGKSGWKWPKEYTHITVAYPGFLDWVNGRDATGEWVNHPAAGQVFEK